MFSTRPMECKFWCILSVVPSDTISWHLHRRQKCLESNKAGSSLGRSAAWLVGSIDTGDGSTFSLSLCTCVSPHHHHCNWQGFLPVPTQCCKVLGDSQTESTREVLASAGLNIRLVKCLNMWFLQHYRVSLSYSQTFTTDRLLHVLTGTFSPYWIYILCGWRKGFTQMNF